MMMLRVSESSRHGNAYAMRGLPCSLLQNPAEKMDSESSTVLSKQMMLSALRTGRRPVFVSSLLPKLSSSSSSSSVGRRSSATCFCAAAEPQKNMESKNPKQDEMTTNPMAESFGTAYATRCDEEGFGGIYGRNKTLPEEGEDDVAVGEARPGYNESQGTEVKEKEKGRNETEATATT